MKFLSMAFKNIFRQKKRSFTLGINYLVISLVLILVFSFSEGVGKNFTTNVIAASAGHLTIAGEMVDKGRVSLGVADYPKVAETLKKEFGPEAQIHVRYGLISTIYNKGLSKRVTFNGFDLEKDLSLKDQVSVNQGSWDAFAQDPQGILLSQETAEYMELKLEDEVVVSTRTRYGAFNTATFKVRGIYTSGNYFVQGLVLSHFKSLQSLDLAADNKATSVFIYFPQMTNLEERRDRAVKALITAGYRAAPPKDSNDAVTMIAGASVQTKPEDESVTENRLKVATVHEVIGLLSQILRGINFAGGALAVILFFIIAISIFINMRMTINDRLQEIGTLKAIGTPPSTIIFMLIFENLFLGALFVVFGLGLGLGIIGLMSQVITLPPAGVLSLFLEKGHLVMIPTLQALGTIAGITLGFTAFFSYFPARYGGKIPAVVALNKTY